MQLLLVLFLPWTMIHMSFDQDVAILDKGTEVLGPLQRCDAPFRSTSYCLVHEPIGGLSWYCFSSVDVT